MNSVGKMPLVVKFEVGKCEDGPCGDWSGFRRAVNIYM